MNIKKTAFKPNLLFFFLDFGWNTFSFELPVINKQFFRVPPKSKNEPEIEKIETCLLLLK